jgi:hypothetical protein
MASFSARTPRFGRSAVTVGGVVLLALGGVVVATQASSSFNAGAGAGNAIQLQGQHTARNGCDRAGTAGPKTSGPGAKWGSYTDRYGATQHHAEGLAPETSSGAACSQPVAGNGNAGSGNAGNGNAGNGNADPTPAPSASAGLEILGNTCAGSQLQAHDGFQAGNRCVSTEFGEVGDFDKNPTLLITGAPRRVRVNTTFTLKVSTRNIVRDRFLAAAKGGYYKESSFLNANGLVRGHFHTACRMLASTTEAPASDPPPAFFVATEDGKGSATSDTVTIAVAGMPTTGTAQCAAWAGDGSHRIPMMASVQAIPAMDTVEFRVTR